MFGSDVLEIAIGLFFIYSLLSVIGSAIAELIEAKLKLRARDLERGLREMLDDPQGTGLVQRLYKHPLIFGLFQGSYKVQSNGLDWSNLPSYIPARNFALALIDTLAPLKGAGAVLGNNPPQAAVELRSILNSQPGSQVPKALVALLNGANADLNTFRLSVEQWYDSTMDRVAGWYKRRTQVVLLCIGIALAVAANADTVSIFSSLSKDRAMRESLVAAAQAAAKEDSSASGSPEERIEKTLEKLLGYGLPLGWDTTDKRIWPETWGGRLTKIVGWLLTGLAVSLGAPFWFDLLNRVMIIRSTVKPHEKSPEEPSEDK